uniref:Uncharacterized protein n=1 Tax=Romanomermis culicivorax TaxID=13658 RepID=A0A915K0I1_ROMCU
MFDKNNHCNRFQTFVFVDAIFVAIDGATAVAVPVICYAVRAHRHRRRFPLLLEDDGRRMMPIHGTTEILSGVSTASIDKKTYLSYHRNRYVRFFSIYRRIDSSRRQRPTAVFYLLMMATTVL